MIDKNESNSIEDSFSEGIIEVIKKNENLLNKYGKGVLNEVIGLSYDAVDYDLFLVNKNIEQYSMVFFTNHILMPVSHAIYADLLSGNLTACFMQLRLMIESLAKCYLADLIYPKENFCHKKILSLQVGKKNVRDKPRRKTDTEIIKEFDKELGLGNDTEKLYRELSDDWIHTKGFMYRILAEESDIPEYDSTKSQLSGIDNLHKRISQFRTILKAAMEKYKHNCT